MGNIMNHLLKNPLTKSRESNQLTIKLRTNFNIGIRSKEIILSICRPEIRAGQKLSQCKHRFTRETKRIIGDRNRQLHLSAFNRRNIAVFSIGPLSISKWEGMISHVKSGGLVRENCRNAAVKAVAP